MTVCLDKKKILLLYQYYLLGWINPQGIKEEVINWFNNECLTKENFLQKKVVCQLKSDWEFSRLPPLEKAILIYGTHEIFEQKPHHSNLVINNVINFSKAYLEKEKIGYINKVLDLIREERGKNNT